MFIWRKKRFDAPSARRSGEKEWNSVLTPLWITARSFDPEEGWIPMHLERWKHWDLSLGTPVLRSNSIGSVVLRRNSIGSGSRPSAGRGPEPVLVILVMKPAEDGIDVDRHTIRQQMTVGL